MWKKYNKYRVLKVFFNDPLPKGGYQLREISRLVNVSPKSVGLYLQELTKEGFVRKEGHRIHGFPVYYGNRESPLFRLHKKLDLIASLHETGLVDFLHESCSPECIVLFGSAGRGEDVKGSDIDLYLEAKEKKISLSGYERGLGRKINPFYGPDYKKLSCELRNNIANGVILKGYLRVC